MKILIFFLTGIAILFSTGCASILEDSLFLVNNLDNDEKSNVITEKGIKLYKTELEGQENYQKLSEIKEYFMVALRFNPENEKAEEYLEKINNFIIAKVEEKLAIARKLIKMKKRTGEEDFTLAYAVRKAYELDPENSDVLRLKKETAGLTGELTVKYLKQTESELNKIKEEDSPLDKSNKYINAYDNCLKAFQLDPENKEVKSKKQFIESELEVIFTSFFKEAKEELGKNDFKGAEASLKTCNGINKKLDAKYKDDINTLLYELNYRWAGVLLSKKDYRGAEAKIKTALRVKRTSDAVDLRNKITRLKNDDEFAKSFKTWLDEIDSLIAKKSLEAAYNKIQGILSKTDNKNYIKELKTREGNIKNQLAGIYESAINYYKQENFKEAIRLLKIIVNIDATYKKAGDYLEKAESRQKLLDSY